MLKYNLFYFIASRYGYKNVIEFLLSKGAEVNIKDNEGHTALDIGNLK
jgi:ankyrin repeat protein